MTMPTASEVLAKPLTLPCGQTVPNRLCKAAMTEQMADPRTNAPNERHLRLYERWGQGGAGILLTGNVMVDRVCMENARNIAVEDERDLGLLTEIAARAQAHGSQLWMQISHAGRQSPKKVTKQPVIPSDVGFERAGLKPIFAKPRPLSVPEIHETIKRFANTAAIAQKAGFSGIQIHAAHGYLNSQFLSPLTNKRTDEWGGSLENRMRFLLSIVRETRERVGPAFPISVKLNSADFQRGGFSEEESLEVVRALEEASVDLLEISGGNYENPAMMSRKQSTRDREAFFLEYAEKVRGVSGIPLMLTGGFRTAHGMAEAIQPQDRSRGAIDIAGLARPLCVEPDLCNELLRGTKERAAPLVIETGIRLFDDMLQSFWYNHQMRRMAGGQEPNPRISKYRILAIGLAEQVWANPFAKTREYPPLETQEA